MNMNAGHTRTHALMGLILSCLWAAGCGQPNQPPSDGAGQPGPQGHAISAAAPVARGPIQRLSPAELAAEPPSYPGSVSRDRNWSPASVAGVLRDAESQGRTVLIRLSEGHDARDLERLAGVRLLDSVGFGTNIHEVRIAGDAGQVAERLLAAGSSEVVSINGEKTLAARRRAPNDPLFGKQWALRGKEGGIKGPRAWNRSSDGSHVLVGVIDTGVDTRHPDLRANTRDGFDVTTGSSKQYDLDGHGTAVAGLIGATGNNAVGVSGVCWRADILPVRVFNDRGVASLKNYVRGIHRAIDAGCRILNISLGGGAARLEYEALVRARRNGVLVVTAAGNDGFDNDIFPVFSYPAAYPLDNIVSVAATDRRGRMAFFSNRGAFSVDLAAPGQGVKVIGPDGGYPRWDGTSFSSPIVAGAAALVWSQNTELSYRQVRKILVSTCSESAALVDLVQSDGLLNLNLAVRAAKRSRRQPRIAEAELELAAAGLDASLFPELPEDSDFRSAPNAPAPTPVDPAPLSAPQPRPNAATPAPQPQPQASKPLPQAEQPKQAKKPNKPKQAKKPNKPKQANKPNKPNKPKKPKKPNKPNKPNKPRPVPAPAPQPAAPAPQPVSPPLAVQPTPEAPQAAKKKKKKKKGKKGKRKQGKRR